MGDVHEDDWASPSDPDLDHSILDLEAVGEAGEEVMRSPTGSSSVLDRSDGLVRLRPAACVVVSVDGAVDAAMEEMDSLMLNISTMTDAEQDFSLLETTMLELNDTFNDTMDNSYLDVSNDSRYADTDISTLSVPEGEQSTHSIRALEAGPTAAAASGSDVVSDLAAYRKLLAGLTSNILVALSNLTAAQPDNTDAETPVPHTAAEAGIGYIVWTSLFTCFNRLVAFRAQHILTRLADTTHTLASPPSHVEVCLQSCTRMVTVSHDRLGIRNDSWSFESVRATHHALPGSRAYYEVLIESQGIVQVGWCTPECRFEATRGLGVGDDCLSYAYDGARQCAFHGPNTRVNHETYGRLWHCGDVVGCLLDLVSGTISYRLNGDDLGVAFTDVDTSQLWFPAVSVATGQQVKLQFQSGGFAHKCAPGYAAIPFLSKGSQLGRPSSSQNDEAEAFELTPLPQSPPIPSMYIESLVANLSGGSFGFRADDGFVVAMGVSSEGHLKIGRHVMMAVDERDVLGCGVCGNAVFFTINGRQLASAVEYQGNMATLRPELILARPNVNFGQQPFAFLPANHHAVRAAMVRCWIERALRTLSSAATASPALAQSS